MPVGETSIVRVDQIDPIRPITCYTYLLYSLLAAKAATYVKLTYNMGLDAWESKRQARTAQDSHEAGAMYRREKGRRGRKYHLPLST